MLGQLKLETGVRCRGSRREDLYGLPVLRIRTDPEGWLGEYRLRRAGRTLYRSGAIRVLTPKAFSHWELLERCGLIPVDPAPFLRAQSPELVLSLLERQNLDPEQATVALRGLRADREMARAAEKLCRRVGRLVISAPRGGAELADWLRWEFGVPVLPPEEAAQVAVRFHPESLRQEDAALDLYGYAPGLAGLRLAAPTLAEEDREDLLLLSALWEGGRLRREELKIT